MTAKEKAKEIVSKFTFLSYPESNAKFYNPKQCALISVDEIIDVCNVLEPWLGLEFWQEVKKEIELL